MQIFGVLRDTRRSDPLKGFIIKSDGREMRSMREYDLLLVAVLLMVFGLLGYHYGQTLKDSGATAETSQQAYSAAAPAAVPFGK